MNKLVSLNDSNEPVTTSLKVAEHFERPHKDILKSIKKLIADLAAITAPNQQSEEVRHAPNFIETTYEVEGQLNRYTMYEMNFPAFSLLAMGFNNTPKVLKFKLDFINAFEAMRKALERRAFDFHAMRQITVDNTKRLHKVIQEVVIPNARKNGSTTADKYFHMNYEKLINKTIGVPAGQRPNLSYGLQSDIARLDEVVEASIVKQAQAGKTHKEIYSSTKDTVQTYAAAALLGERTENLPKFVETPKRAVKSTTIQISIF